MQNARFDKAKKEFQVDQPGVSFDAAQAQIARVEQADHVRTAALCKLCGNADASAGDDDGLTGVNRCLESLLDFLTGETFCHNASSLIFRSTISVS